MEAALKFRQVVLLLSALAAAASPQALQGGPQAPPGVRMPAPELDGAEAWINASKPLRIADLKGKVVLIDFWTYG